MLKYNLEKKKKTIAVVFGKASFVGVKIKIPFKTPGKTN